MRISCVQLDMKLCENEYNYSRAEELIRRTVQTDSPDVILLPETWTSGYYPRVNLEDYCDRDGETLKNRFSALSRELKVNIVAGSIANIKDGGIYNTSFIFDRGGNCVAEYDKTHLFTPMDEHRYFEFGGRVVSFELDGVECGIIICYDLRFPELIRTLALRGIKVLFMVSQWPDKRVPHLLTLTKARAVENQMFVACCNSCGTAGDTVFGGNSQIIDPWGEVLCRAGSQEEVITADCDLSVINDIRNSINVFNDRKPNLYNI
ncbi:MAG: carbon-nitrogen family hydrolase [Clostridia bacterium]|nr:carbon-nitrogen family hydrolase [Clostridia bacterium]